MVHPESRHASKLVLVPNRAIEDIVVSASLVIDRIYSLASRTERSLKAARHFDICELRSSVCRIVRRAVQHQDGYLHAGSEVRRMPWIPRRTEYTSLHVSDPQHVVQGYPSTARVPKKTDSIWPRIW